MSFLNFRRLVKSFRFALLGLSRAFQEEQNFRLQVIAAIAVLILMLVLPVTPMEAAVLILVVTAVLVIELVNTIFEGVVDLLKPRLDHHVAIIKDFMAAAVFVSSVGAILVGLIIFLPYLLGSRP